MKLTIVFALLLVVFVTYTTAQRCVGRPRNPSCTGAANRGRRGPRCTPRTMWTYNARTRSCVELRYLGCGGNNNRWCTKASCEQRCRRAG